MRQIYYQSKAKGTKRQAQSSMHGAIPVGVSNAGNNLRARSSAKFSNWLSYDGTLMPCTQWMQRIQQRPQNYILVQIYKWNEIPNQHAMST